MHLHVHLPPSILHFCPAHPPLRLINAAPLLLHHSRHLPPVLQITHTQRETSPCIPCTPSLTPTPQIDKPRHLH
jgi:hypothetical protein